MSRASRESASPRLRPDLRLLEPPLSRRRSAQSVSAASQSDEQRSIYQRIGSRHSHHAHSHGHSHSSKSYSPRTGPVQREPPAARSVPAWVKHGDDEETCKEKTPLAPPDNARIAEHHYDIKGKKPIFDNDNDYGEEEEEEDDDDEGDPLPTAESRWRTFTRSIPLSDENPRTNVVTADWLNQNFGDYSGPWNGCLSEKDPEAARQQGTFIQRRKRWVKGIQYRILHSPMVPLIIRATVFIFSAIALSLGGSLRQLSTTYDRTQGPSPIMAIIFDAIALIYLVYITYDEYTGKPLGLRSASAKIRLIFLDLVFIVFASANLSLAFASLSDVNGSCSASEEDQEGEGRNSVICARQKVLAAVLLVVLVAWLMTFMISALRVIERVASAK